ncbi:MAG: 16S rRNA (guanine(966)-N(2))-methyltransferase RsmD [Acidobacteriota bacterium]|nr:16S rRNA (guanine(966)-N(2))-methyltransferase RsmD [Acidobacteriota bacterium]
MRVIAGEFRSRKLLSPEGFETRPTSDRLRQTLFNILGGEVEGCVFADLYAGSGAVGIEALSRGARLAFFVEKDKRAIEVIEENLANLKIAGRARVIRGHVVPNLEKVDAGIVFVDPPYTKEREYQAAMDVLEANPPGLTVVQHSVRLALAENFGPMRRVRVLKQGENALSFYRP